MLHEAAHAPPRPAAPRARWTRRRITPYLFVAPTALFLFIGTIFSSVYALAISFTEYQLQFDPVPRFNGLSNYIEAVKDALFWQDILQTALIAVPALIGEFVLGFAVALLLNRSFWGRAIAISAIATPVMVSDTAAGMAFRLLYEPRYGPINDILSRFSSDRVVIDWLGSPALARMSVVLIDVWHASPFVMLLLLAGLGAINPEIYEAARVDGASTRQLFVNITVPLLRPVLTLILLLRGIDLTRIFDYIYIVTKGGPGTSTQTISYYIYLNGLQFFRVGYGAATGVLLAVVTIVFARYYLGLMRGAR
ncbi:MAG: sugar ABC transporter permease [Chloroflexota bacterium]|nr:sugar ABC transporter permease [Chloroflexota bacterium]